MLYPKDPITRADKIKSFLVAYLPQHLVSRIVHAAVRLRWAPWTRALIFLFRRAFGVNMEESLIQDTRRFEHFNAFFTRELSPGTRPLPSDPNAVACPVDGRVSAMGTIRGHAIIQAKGHDYSVAELLGGDAALADSFDGGSFATLYLAPGDYHRVHMPVDGELETTIHVPGRLFSVAPFSIKTVPNLFARNERVASVFNTPRGKLALVMVGAINVGSIETGWAGEITPPSAKEVQTWHAMTGVHKFKRGEEMGRFNMGSTVILLFQRGKVSWKSGLKVDETVKLGQVIGS